MHFRAKGLCRHSNARCKAFVAWARCSCILQLMRTWMCLQYIVHQIDTGYVSEMSLINDRFYPGIFLTILISGTKDQLMHLTVIWS
jgi:hypothetical protein